MLGLKPEFDPQLAGKSVLSGRSNCSVLYIRVPWYVNPPHLCNVHIAPRPNTLSRILAIQGDNTLCWNQIFEAGQVTAPQLLEHIRCLIFLDYPTEAPRDILLRNIGKCPPARVLKVRQLVEFFFSPDYVDGLVTRIKLEEVTPGQENEVRVVLNPILFKVWLPSTHRL